MKYPVNSHIWVRYFEVPFEVNETLPEVRKKLNEFTTSEWVTFTGAGDVHYSVDLRREDISVLEDEPVENDLDAFRGEWPPK